MICLPNKWGGIGATKRALTKRNLSSYSLHMRRKPGSLVPLEVEILSALERADVDLHGFELARRIAADGQRRLAAHGTLYKALARLTESGLVESSWEEPVLAQAQKRPQRRNYRISALGVAALSRATSPGIQAFGAVTA